ncbi:MAG TPA: PQQ-binding-like beta-propeller repeat protein [Chthoniobacteraceae bacterium]|nr:PQQ-binding-like beta-propeller repeat protein [Chthoniobacteraceae bacterium]
MTLRLALAASISFALLVLNASADWLHYRGPTQNGVVSESLPGSLPSDIKPLWKINVGTGLSSITATGDRIFTAGNRDKKNDTLVCLDANTGKEIWQHTYPQALEAKYFEGGPRSTPTIDGGNVYWVAQYGDLFCLDAATGKVKWYKHFQKEFGGRRPDWGFSGSPTIDGDLLLLDVGGEGASTVALNKNSGDVAWKSGSDQPGYGSPVVADLNGKRVVLVFKAQAIVGYDLKDGTEQFRSEWKTNYDVNAISPLVTGNSILVSSGYNTGAALYKVGARGLERTWFQKKLRAQMNTPIVSQGHVFGIDGNNGGGNLVCLNLTDGSEVWREKSVRGGSLVLAGDKLICLSEQGELVVAEASAAGFKPLLRNHILDGRSWVQPTYSGGKLFLKNNTGELVCVKLK